MDRRRWAQIALGILWLGLGLSSVVFWWLSDLPLAEVPERLRRWLDEFGTGPAIGVILALYTIRPLLLFPSSVMGVVSGLTFGPLLGCLVTALGELLGAALAFTVTRVLARRWVSVRETAWLADWDRRLSHNGLATVCILRLILLPFDTVSYLCGLTGIRLRDFLLGTLAGGSFYILGITLLGGSASAELTGEVEIWGIPLSHRVVVLLLSALSFVIGFLLAWRLRKRFAVRDTVSRPGLPEDRPP